MDWRMEGMLTSETAKPLSQALLWLEKSVFREIAVTLREHGSQLLPTGHISEASK
jgi:hypothetical protein